MSRIERNADQARSEIREKEFEAHKERVIGPTREFESTQQCPKCGAPREKFAFNFCPGFAATLDPDVQACKRRGDHIHLACGRCSFPMIEHCADRSVVTLEGGE